MKTFNCYLICCFSSVVLIAAQQAPKYQQELLRRLRSHKVTRKEREVKYDEIKSFEYDLWIQEEILAMSFHYTPKINVVLEWNDVAMKVVIVDYTKPSNQSCSLPPPANALQLAKTHLAMYDALGSVLENGRDPYLLYADTSNLGDVSYEAAVATAAHGMLLKSYPAQEQTLSDAYSTTIMRLEESLSSLEIMNGQIVGTNIVDAYVNNRTNDGSCPIDTTYVWRNTPGQHQPDPTHPKQGIVSPNYGGVTFLVESSSSIELKPPPALESEEYAFAYDQVKRLGGDNVTTPADRTWQESVAAWYFAFDGAPYLGSPAVLINLAARQVIDKMVTDEVSLASEQEDNAVSAAYILAQMYAAMADAGILTWKQKFKYNFWRPMVAIRNAATDGNDATTADVDWNCLGAPKTNPSTPGQTNFDPAFPAYSSGHASFCYAGMKALANTLQTNEVEFELISWEFNGTTTDERGNIRPKLYQKFSTLSEFSSLCAASRVWGGVHWCTDCQEGCHIGCMTADKTYENAMTWKQDSGNTNLPAIKTEFTPEEEVMAYLERKKTPEYFIDGKTEEEVRDVVMGYFDMRYAQMTTPQIVEFSSTDSTYY